MRKRKKVLALLLCASMTAGMVPVTSNAEGDGQLIATYVNQVPEMDGVTWADDVAAETFANAWETVTASTASDSGTGGTTYQVEVVPEDLVYFIDSYSNAPSADDSTPVYDAVKALVPDLKNEAADQLYVEGENTWGLSGSVNTKGNTTATDKTDTGVYGSSNASGSSLSYSLYLEAGTYTITSEHHDWWWMDRPMSISLSHDGTDETLGSISLNNSHNNEIVSYDFTINETDKQAIRDAQNYAGQDAMRVKAVDLLSEAQRLLNQADQEVNARGRQLDKGLKKQIKNDTTHLRKLVSKCRLEKVDEAQMDQIRSAKEQLERTLSQL